MPFVLAAVIGVLVGLTTFGVAVAAFVSLAAPVTLGLIVGVVAALATAAKLKAATSPDTAQ